MPYTLWQNDVHLGDLKPGSDMVPPGVFDGMVTLAAAFGECGTLMQFRPRSRPDAPVLQTRYLWFVPPGGEERFWESVMPDGTRITYSSGASVENPALTSAAAVTELLEIRDGAMQKVPTDWLVISPQFRIDSTDPRIPAAPRRWMILFCHTGAAPAPARPDETAS